MTAAVLKNYDKNPRLKAGAMEVRGRPRLRLAGSHLDDLAVLGKAIWLLPDEASRFNAEAYGYATHPRIPRVRGHSDASGVFGECVLFIKKDR